MRSILHDILKQGPEFVPKAFPRQWDHLSSTESAHAYDVSLTDDDVQCGLDNLVRLPGLEEKYRLCFFIDALDELEEKHQMTYQDLIHLLREWTTTSSSAIKICVSSREDSVFRDNFAAAQRFHLHDLTQDDILRYTRERLLICESVADRKRLVTQIVTRSEGVFLWVTLVVKAIRQGLGDRRDIPSLEKELAILPTELDELFEYLLSSISPTELRRAYQLFAMVQMSESFKTRLSASCCLFLDDFEEDSEFAIHEFGQVNMTALDEWQDCWDCVDLDTWAVSHKDHEDCVYYRYNQQCLAAQTRIQAYCKGLVEVRKWTVCDYDGRELPESPGGSECLSFVHRSVIEFLRHKTRRAIMAEQLSNFEIVEAISQVHLAEFARLHAVLIDSSYWTFIYTDIITMRAQYVHDGPSFEFLETLIAAIRSKFPELLKGPKGRYIVSDVKDLGPYLRVFVNPIRRRTKAIKEYGIEAVPLTSPLYIAAFFGNAEYAQWKLSTQPELFKSPRAPTLLLHCLCAGIFQVDHLSPERYAAFQYCFKHAISSELLASPQTLWSHFVASCFCYSGNFTEQSEIDADGHLRHKLMGWLFALFLKRSGPTALHTLRIQWRFLDDRSALMASTNEDEGLECPIHCQFLWDVPAYVSFLAGKVKEAISLCQLAEFWDFENKEEIINLIVTAERARDGTSRRDAALIRWSVKTTSVKDLGQKLRLHVFLVLSALWAALERRTGYHGTFLATRESIVTRFGVPREIHDFTTEMLSKPGKQCLGAWNMLPAYWTLGGFSLLGMSSTKLIRAMLTTRAISDNVCGRCVSLCALMDGFAAA